MQPLYEYVCHIKGHRNSKGELAEWVIKSHETGKILSSHKSEKKAKEHLQQMHIFKESVDGAGYPKMYHICGYMTGLDNDDIKDILTNGLRINDNGESNCIWFSMNKPFGNGGYDALRPLIVSLDCSPENLRKYRIAEFDVRNNADVVMAHESISPEDINIEQLMWGEIHRPSNNTVRQIIDPSFYGNFDRWSRFDKGLTFVVYEDLYNMWARNQIAKMGLNPDLNRLKEIMGDRVTITNFLTPSEPTGYKLLGESTNGNTMDKRFNIFMESVGQLGLSKNQVDAIGKITNTCMESATFGNTEDDDNDNPENDYNPENGEYDNPENDTPANDYTPENDETSGDEDNAEYAHELTMDEMYDKLIEQGVSKQTINIVTDIIGWNPDSMLKILDAATGYKSFDQLPEF